MKKIVCWVAVLGLCLLPLAGRAWLIEPENVLESREDLPGGVRGLLPGELALEYAYRFGDFLYVWTKTTRGDGTVLVFAQADDGYSLLAQSAPLGMWNGYAPSLGFSGSDFFSISYGESYFVFCPWNNGRWALNNAYLYQGFGQPDYYVAYYPHAMTEAIYESHNDDSSWRIIYGTWKRSLNLDSLDLSDLPETFADMSSLLDTEGWAMTNPPEPGGRVLLYAAPSAAAQTLGAYYAGASAEVLESNKDWYRVTIAGAEGWMLAETLAFGEAMREVPPDFPALDLADEVYNGKNVLYAEPSVESALVNAAYSVNAESLFIIGVVKDGWYHVMNLFGDQGYIQSKWFSEGNG